MQQTVRKMEPVLGSFRDQVLFLKHNLNAQAVGSLQTTAAKLDGEVGALMKDIEASMIAADDLGYGSWAFRGALTSPPRTWTLWPAAVSASVKVT